MKMFKLARKKKGVSNLVYALLTVPLILIISIAIFSGFQTNIDRSNWSAEANSTFGKVVSGTWSGFNLGSMLPFVLISMTVVGVVLGMFIARRL
jgi:hypothetical protein